MCAVGPLILHWEWLLVECFWFLFVWDVAQSVVDEEKTKGEEKTEDEEKTKYKTQLSESFNLLQHVPHVS